MNTRCAHCACFVTALMIMIAAVRYGMLGAKMKSCRTTKTAVQPIQLLLRVLSRSRSGVNLPLPFNITVALILSNTIFVLTFEISVPILPFAILCTFNSDNRKEKTRSQYAVVTRSLTIEKRISKKTMTVFISSTMNESNMCA